jgi:flagellar hook-length control protein FliK
LLGSDIRYIQGIVMTISAVATSLASGPSTVLATNADVDKLPFDFAALLTDQFRVTGEAVVAGNGDTTVTNPVNANELGKETQLLEGVLPPLDPNTLQIPLATTAMLSQNLQRGSEPRVDQDTLADGSPEGLRADNSPILPDVAKQSLTKPVSNLGETSVENRATVNPAQTLAPGVQRSFDKVLASQPAPANGQVFSTNQLVKIEPANFALKPIEPQDNPTVHVAHTNGNLFATSSTPNTPQPNQPAERIAAHLHAPEWSRNLGDKVIWLAKSEQQVAQISINPPQLGPMQISLTLQGDQATAIFASPHAEVRQAIEDAMPRLREMLSSAGISLGGANVGTQLPQQQREQQTSFAGENRSFRENDILRGDSEGRTITTPPPVNRGRGLIDLFA